MMQTLVGCTFGIHGSCCGGQLLGLGDQRGPLVRVRGAAGLLEQRRDLSGR